MTLRESPQLRHELLKVFVNLTPHFNFRQWNGFTGIPQAGRDST